MNYRQKLEQKKGQKQQIQSTMASLKQRHKSLRLEQDNCEIAQAIIQDVAKKTQNQLSYQISELVSLALAAVFDDPYIFDVEFVSKRNQVECDMWFTRGDTEEERIANRISPLHATGGGVVDIASLALRLSLYTLKKQRTRPLVLLDEPGKMVSESFRERFGEFIQMVSEKLGIQFVIITHQPELASCADRVFKVSIKKGVSKCSIA